MNWSDLLGARLIQHLFLHHGQQARALVQQFPHPGDLLQLDDTALSQWIPDPELLQIWHNPTIRHNLEKELEWYDKYQIQIDYLLDPQYPKRLKECPDAPILLYHRGSATKEPPRSIAIVGTRKATSYGKQVVRDIIQSASLLDPKPIIISGLAYGIDIEAHRCALENNLDTYAILANGLDQIYPSAHRKTAIHILEQGALWSEFPKNTPAYPLHFLQRNRIIAGMSDVVILCESAIRGGGMATARQAASYSREVYALPGRIHDLYSSGCNELIRNQTANLFSSPDQLWKDLGWNRNKKKKQNPKELSIFETPSELSILILERLADHARLTPDELLDYCPQASLQDLSIALTALEIEGLIEQDTGGFIKRR